MKTLHSYLTRQVLASLLMTVMVFTFVLLVGNVLKEILPLLVSGKVSFGVVATAVGLLVPFVWVFALPMGILTATLLIFGRFSADQEFTAVRASGLSLLSLVSPVLLLSLALCGVSALVNMELGPRCRVLYTTLLYNLGVQFSTAHLPEGHFISDFEGYIFYVGKNRAGELEDVTVFKLQNRTNVDWTVRAPRGRMVVDTPHNAIHLTLYDATVIERSGDLGSTEEGTMDLPLDSPGQRKPKIDDMTFPQLWQEMHQLHERLRLPLPTRHLAPEQVATWKKQLKEWREELLLVTFHIHRQVAFSFACFGFTLVGIPLGIRVHRRETNVGVAIALLLVALYYSFILLGQAFDTRPEYLPHLIVWAPNFLFQGAGAFLLWRANAGR